jgi:signal transduction histidine kinase
VFEVDPLFWEARWFRVTGLAAFLGLLWAAYRSRIHQLAREFNLRLDERIEERTRIARELHDTLLQSFHGLMLRFQTARNMLPGRPAEAAKVLESALDRADQAITEGRDAIQNMRSSTLISNDLAEAVQAAGDELVSGDTAEFRLVLEGRPRNLHPVVRDEVYRIAREAIRNAFRHARARVIEAEITYAESQLRLRVRDDGNGIEPAIASEGRSGHYGVPGMRERAAGIGARLNIWAGKGAGTEVELIIPGSIAFGTFGVRPGSSLFRR